jgi:hypothetical protein
MQHYYEGGGVRFSPQTGLIGPVEEDRINKIEDKYDADQEGGILEKPPIVMRDHEIDGVHAEDHDQKAIQHLEVRHEVIPIPEYQPLDQPDQAGKGDKDRIQLLPVPEKPPLMKLPGDQQPLKKHINGDDRDIVHMQYDEHKRVDQFEESRQQHENKKGLVAALFYSIQPYQPGNNRKIDGYAKKK